MRQRSWYRKYSRIDDDDSHIDVGDDAIDGGNYGDDGDDDDDVSDDDDGVNKVDDSYDDADDHDFCKVNWVAIENRQNSLSRTVWKVGNKNIVVVVDDNSDLLIGVWVRLRVRVRVLSSEHNTSKFFALQSYKVCAQYGELVLRRSRSLTPIRILLMTPATATENVVVVPRIGLKR